VVWYCFCGVQVGKYWCEGEAIDGKAVYDSKVFK
jgi:hypothetical protein